jgi:DNA-binding protein H-NS
MAKKLADIQKQIAKLKLEAAAMVTKGRREAISTVNTLLKEFQLTAADLNFGTAAAGKRGRSAGVVRKGTTPPRAGAGVAKYRDAASGKTWTGFGKPPNWIKDAPDRSVFLISGAGQASAPAPSTPATKAPAKRRVALKSNSKPAAKKGRATKKAAKADAVEAPRAS